jgi:DNA-binding CsgD family transcriptional regulator
MPHWRFRSDARLTRREREVLKWIALGKTSKEIGDILAISGRTVEWHTHRAMKKLDANSRIHAVLIAMANGFTLS